LAKLHDRLLPAGANSLRDAAPLRLRLHPEDLHVLNRDLEQLLDRLANLGLVRVLVHLERVLAVGDERVALLRHDRREEDLVRMEAHSAASFSAATPARANTSGSAASEMRTERAHTSDATSSSAGATPRTFSRLRKDFTSSSSSSVTTTRVGRSPKPERSSAAFLVEG